MLHMKKNEDMNHLLLLSKAFGNPVRLEILFVLSTGECYVSELARKLDISRALLYLHLKKLEEANVVYSDTKISSEGKALKYYYINSFEFVIDNNLISDLANKKYGFKE